MCPSDDADDRLDSLDAWHFDLPADRIAERPLASRSASRMMVVHASDGSIAHTQFASIAEMLGPNDLLVVNDVRVGQVRLHARRATGGRVEVFVVGFGDEGRWDAPEEGIVALVRSHRGLRPGESVALEGLDASLIMDRAGDGGLVWFRIGHLPEGVDAHALLDAAGQVPLPPYIVKRRKDLAMPELEDADRERYQTVYAGRVGAVAAPTAGLHFDTALLDALTARGVRRAAVTLYVGIGTFRPVSASRLSAHTMHEERYEIPESTAHAIAETRRRGGRVVAVGTTVVRTLEAAALAWEAGRVAGAGPADAAPVVRGASDGWATADGPRSVTPVVAGQGSTALMIRPGHRFRVVDALVTNFHLPQSTLLALVAAFAGYDLVMRAYREAVDAQYRFFSYGDAMFLPARRDP